MTGSPDDKIRLGAEILDYEKKQPKPISNTLRFPTDVTVNINDLKRGSFVPFSGAITGSISTITNGLAALSPNQPFKLRGGRLNLLVTTQLAASAPGVLGVYDGNYGGLLCTLVAHSSTQSAHTLLASELEFHLGEGQKIVGPIYLAGTQDIGGGQIHASGQLFGTYKDG